MGDNVTVVGEGSWGTTLAKLLAQNGNVVQLLCHFPAVAVEVVGALCHGSTVSILQRFRPEWCELIPKVRFLVFHNHANVGQEPFV